MWAKKGASEHEFFWDPFLSAENRPQPPQKVHSGASGSQKAPKMEPKNDTLGTYGKSIVVSIYNVFSTFEGPRMAPTSILFWKTLLEFLFACHLAPYAVKSQPKGTRRTPMEKAPKMEPKSDTFRDLWKVIVCCYFAMRSPLLRGTFPESSLVF